MKSKLYYLLMFAAVAFASCKKTSDNSQTQVTPSNSVSVNIETSPSVLNRRVNTSNIGVMSLTKASKTGRLQGNVITNPYPVTKQGSIANPLVSGFPTIPTDMVLDVSTHYAYVAYARGDGGLYAGAIDIIKYTTLTAPTNTIGALTTHLTFTKAQDISSLAKVGSTLYYAGAADEHDLLLTQKAIFGSIALDGGGGFTGTVTQYNLTGQKVTGFVINAGKAYITTDAALLTFDLTSHTVTNTIALADCRGVALNAAGSVLSVLTGTKLYNYNFPALTAINNATLGQDLPNAPRNLAYANNGTTDYLYIAGGRAGTYYYSSNVQKDIVNVPSSSPGVDPTMLATYSVAADDNFTPDRVAFAANGYAGVYIMYENPNHTIALAGSLELTNAAGTSAVPAFVVKCEGPNPTPGGQHTVLVGTGSDIQVLTFDNAPGGAGNVACNGLPLYNGLPDLTVTSNLQYGGPTGWQTFVNTATYVHCGNTSASKNFVLTSGSSGTFYGNISQGYYNSYWYLSVEDNATLTVQGDLNIYGDLVLGNNAKIIFSGAGHKLKILGNVFKGTGSQIQGSPTEVADQYGNTKWNAGTPLAVTYGASTFHTLLQINMPVNGDPATSQGVFITKQNGSCGVDFAFDPLWPRDSNVFNQMNVYEGATLMFKMAYSQTYEGKSFGYTKSNATKVTGTFSNNGDLHL